MFTARQTQNPGERYSNLRWCKGSTQSTRLLGNGITFGHRHAVQDTSDPLQASGISALESHKRHSVGMITGLQSPRWRARYRGLCGSVTTSSNEGIGTLVSARTPAASICLFSLRGRRSRQNGGMPNFGPLSSCLVSNTAVSDPVKRERPLDLEVLYRGQLHHSQGGSPRDLRGSIACLCALSLAYPPRLPLSPGEDTLRKPNLRLSSPVALGPAT